MNADTIFFYVGLILSEWYYFPFICVKFCALNIPDFLYSIFWGLKTDCIYSFIFSNLLTFIWLLFRTSLDSFFTYFSYVTLCTLIARVVNGFLSYSSVGLIFSDSFYFAFVCVEFLVLIFLSLRSFFMFSYFGTSILFFF